MFDRVRVRRPERPATKRGRLRPFASLVLLLLTAQALAGCADAPDAEAATPPVTDVDDADGSDPPGSAGDDADAGTGAGAGGSSSSSSDGTFVVEGLRILDQDANETLHEDDRASATYTVRHPGTPDERVTRFVSFAVEGQIVQVDQVSLGPGESKEFEHELGAVRGLESLAVEVRVGPTRERAEAAVEAWPRTGERVAIGPLSVEVRRWLRDVEDGSTLVNATFTRADDPDAPGLGDFEARILCTDARGNITTAGEAHPSLPAAGASSTQNVRLPECEDMLYGVSFTATVDGEQVERRVLYVERGWQPPAQDP